MAACSRANHKRLLSGTVDDDDYEVYCCGDDHVHVNVTTKLGTTVSLVFEDLAAYDFAHAILRGFDEINGIDVKLTPAL